MLRIASLVAVALSLCASVSSAAVVNLAETATGFGTLPSVTLFQGSVAGIADGNLWSWWGPVTSPRRLDTSIQPYMTWSTTQEVRIVRAHRDASGDWDRLMIDTLIGTDPTNEANWVNRYDSGPGLTGAASRFQEVDLGATHVTRGVRVRGFRAAADSDVGEVAVFAPQSFAGTLTSMKIAPTSIAASSSEFRAASLAVNDDWYDGGWLSANVASNPGTDFTFDLNFAGGEILNGLSYTWTAQSGFSEYPSQWELLIDTGAGLTSLGLFTPTMAQNGQSRRQYYYDFGTTEDVLQIRLRVPESAVSGTGRVGLMEFEAFYTQEPLPPIPEPSAAVLVALGLPLFASRRRRQK